MLGFSFVITASAGPNSFTIVFIKLFDGFFCGDPGTATMEFKVEGSGIPNGCTNCI